LLDFRVKWDIKMKILNKKEKSFTIIELLVVVSIIGLLGSIILVAIKDARGKAYIAKSLTFSASIKNSLGAYLVGEWSFNEGSGSIVNDTSGNGNNGNWSGSSWVDNEIKELGKAGNFGGTNYVTITDPGTNSVLDLINKVTIEVWVNPTNPDLFPQYIVNKDTSYTLMIGSNRARFYLQTTSGSVTYASSSSQVFTAGQWHHYVASYEYLGGTSASVKVYVNTKEIPCTIVAGTPGALSQNNLFLRIGQQFPGKIDEVRVYGESLTSSQIEKHYTQGLERHKDLANK
jgi:type II secretory pathway pseudopilin PulG